MNKCISTAALITILWFGACTPEPAPERPRDVWVFRSVLDQRPRMITMTLHEQLAVAYDARTASLYKAWDGGVNLEGAVYNTVHGPQPTSEGYPYYANLSEQTDWRIESGASSEVPQIEYRGHGFSEGHVWIEYELHSEGGKHMAIREWPEVIEQQAKVGLERTFEVIDNEDEITASLSIAFSSMSSPSDLEVEKELSEMETSGIVQEGDSLYTVRGKLKLSADEKVRTAVWYHRPPDPQSMAETVIDASIIQQGRALVDGGDCRTCHNEREKTVGPSYVAIAEKYPYNKDFVSLLANKVIQGGSGSFGEVMMTAHPALSRDDAEKMLHYILSLDGESMESTANSGSVFLEKESAAWNLSEEALEAPEGEDRPGLGVNFYKMNNGDLPLEEVVENYDPILTGHTPYVQFRNNGSFGLFSSYYYVEFAGSVEVPEGGNYQIRLVSDDGSRLYINGDLVIDHSGIHGPDPKDADVTLETGKNDIRLLYFQNTGGAGLSLQWAKEDGSLEVIPESALSHRISDLRDPVPFVPEEDLVRHIPGDQYPVDGVHPSFRLDQARPADFRPRVGGMDFLEDGRLVVSTWDSVGGVYIIENVTSGDSSKMTVKRIAEGLAEPLGLKVVDGEIYVLQKQELTHLVNRDGDERIDEYRTLSDDWQVSANFHEFAFGLVYQEGYFYGTLATAILPGGASADPQIPDRGKAFRVSRDGSDFQFISYGLRTPNGIGVGYQDEIYVADNQGDWLPASKIVRIREGAFHGSRSVDFEGTEGMIPDPPVVWLPQNEIGNSPSTPISIAVGPYSGQMIHGEVTHGGIKRVFPEVVEGVYQGVVFRFTQGLEAGVNRLTWGPDGALYAGGVGSTGNWSHTGGFWYGLQRLTFTDNSAFEMLKVESRNSGFDITFTQPIHELERLSTEDWEVQQWYYLPTENYGGPKMDLTNLEVTGMRLSADRKKIYLNIDGLKEGHVVYIRIRNPFISQNENSLWSTEAWYTLNKISPTPTELESPYNEPEDNTLTQAEEEAGFRLLFDGKSLDGWRNYNTTGVGKQWVVRDNSIHLLEGGGGDIVTEEEMSNYELRLDWRIADNGNSGVIYNVKEGEYNYPWQTGPELQVLDNVGHPDGQIFTHRSGDLYDMIATRYMTVNGPMEWNSIRLIVRENGEVEHWQNGYKVVEYQIGSQAYDALIAKSKFRDMEDFGKFKGGHLSLQDHGDKVWFKNIRIKNLD